MKVKCNKCGYVGDESLFKHGRDFFQNRFVSGCPECDNRQDPGGASLRAMGGERPFEYIRPNTSKTIVDETFHKAGEAS